MMEFEREDANRIKGHRSRLGWSRNELEIRSGVPQSAITRIERNDFPASDLWESYINTIRKVLAEGEKEELPRTDDICDCKVRSKILSNGRWYVSLDHSFCGKKSMLQAHYNWLMSNPLFKEIPKGYVVHHLDRDRNNDDPSNLVLMRAKLHVAHHIKNSEDKSVVLESRPGYPLKIERHGDTPLQFGTNPSVPRVYKTKFFDKEQWIIRWQETHPLTGKRLDRKVSRSSSGAFHSKEDAEKAKEILMKIHPGFREKDEETFKVKNLIWEIHEVMSAKETLSDEEINTAYHLIREVFPKLY